MSLGFVNWTFSVTCVKSVNWPYEISYFLHQILKTVEVCTFRHNTSNFYGELSLPSGSIDCRHHFTRSLKNTVSVSEIVQGMSRNRVCSFIVFSSDRSKSATLYWNLIRKIPWSSYYDKCGTTNTSTRGTTNTCTQ